MHYEIGNRRELGLSNWWVGLFLIGIFKIKMLRKYRDSQQES